MQSLSEQRHSQNQSGDAAENRAADEVGTENSGPPHGHGGHGEVPGNDGVHRHSDGNDDNGHDVHGGFQAMPLARRALPPQSRPAVKFAPQPAGAVTHHGKIGNHGQEKKCKAAGQVGEDGEKIPGHGRAEVGPNLALAGIGDQVIEQPRPSEVGQGNQRADGKGKDGDGLRAPRDGAAPGGVGQAQDRGDERAGGGGGHTEYGGGGGGRPKNRG